MEIFHLKDWRTSEFSGKSYVLYHGKNIVIGKTTDDEVMWNNYQKKGKVEIDPEGNTGRGAVLCQKQSGTER